MVFFFHYHVRLKRLAFGYKGEILIFHLVIVPARNKLGQPGSMLIDPMGLLGRIKIGTIFSSQ